MQIAAFNSTPSAPFCSMLSAVKSLRNARAVSTRSIRFLLWLHSKRVAAAGVKPNCSFTRTVSCRQFHRSPVLQLENQEKDPIFSMLMKGSFGKAQDHAIDDRWGLPPLERVLRSSADLAFTEMAVKSGQVNINTVSK